MVADCRALDRIGSAHAKKGDLENAIRFYNKALAEHRAPETLAKLKEAEKMKQQRDKEAYHNPELAEQERNAGNELFKTGNYAEAVPHYSAAIRRDENDPRAYSNRAACYLKLAAVPEGLRDCERALDLDPAFIKAYIRKAALEFMKRDYAAALETCEKALEHDGDGKHRPEIQAQISRCYSELGRQQTASPEEAAKRAAQNPEIQQILADPVMHQILQQMQSDPKASVEHMRNPMVAGKIRKLVAAGVIRLA